MKVRSTIVFLLSALILGAIIGCSSGGGGGDSSSGGDEQPQVEMTQKVNLTSTGFVEQTIPNPTIDRRWHNRGHFWSNERIENRSTARCY